MVLAVAAIVFAFASPAFAGTGNSGYIDWDTVSALPGQGTSPHGGYSTTTVKCGVCHSVHNASATATVGGDPEMLLASSVADACNYCHVGGAGGYVQVYGGNPSNYQGTDLPNAHNSFEVGGVQQGVTCSICHQVHAANSMMTANPYLTSKLLMGAKTYTAIPSPNYDPIARAPLSSDDSATALTKYCAGCHFTRGGAYTYYSNDYNQQSHIMTTATATYGNPAASFTGKVAWANSTYCSSCHASGYQTAAWPHFTPGARFLTSATDASATAAGAASSFDDGVCLRCHRQGATNGVGLTY
jgi:hypothetical protein